MYMGEGEKGEGEKGKGGKKREGELREAREVSGEKGKRRRERGRLEERKKNMLKKEGRYGCEWESQQ